VVQGLNYRLRLKLTSGISVQAVVHRPLRGEMSLGKFEVLD
jgi:hypothetical protein